MASKSGAAAHVDPANTPSLTLKRRINASPERVYSAWTSPEQIARWFGASEAMRNTARAEIDLRVGGRYRISFTGENGEHHEVGGVYREVVPNARLSFSWSWHSTPERESQVTITLKPDGEGTWLTLHHEQFFDLNARDNHERGWTQFMVRLESLFG